MIRLRLLLSFVTCHLTLASIASAAEPIQLTSETSPDLGPWIELLENLEGIHTVDDAANATGWRPGEAPGAIDVARTGALRVWVRFRVTNLVDVENWIVEYARLPDVFAVHYRNVDRQESWISERMAFAPFSSRPFEHNWAALEMRLEPRTTYEVYLYLEVRAGRIAVLPLTLFSNDALADHVRNESLLYGLYFGIVLVMALYNLFLYLSLRDRAYVYYVLAILGFAFWVAVYTGLDAQYLWPNNSWDLSRLHPTALAFAWFGLILFVREFLETRANAPRLDWLLRGLFVLFIGWPLASLLNRADLIPGLFELCVNLTLWVTFTIAGVKALMRGYRPATFFLLAWGGYMAAGTVCNLAWIGLVRFNDFTATAAFLMGHAIEVILLSLALADRINILRTEKEQQEFAAHEAERVSRETREQSERKSAFLASMAHELRTPLNAIKGFNNLVLRRSGDALPEQQRENLTKVDRASDHLLATINDLLDLSKIEAGRMDVTVTTFDVRQTILSACEVVSPLVQPGVELRHDIPDDIGQAHTDQQRLSQMLINLLSNAIKFTEVGSVTVSASAERENGRGESGRDSLVVTVSDTGRGIPESELPTLFDEYQQVRGQSESAVQRGTGLGLSITKRFVELLGGTIAVESEAGAGSTFTITLPLSYGGEGHGYKNEDQGSIS